LQEGRACLVDEEKERPDEGGVPRRNEVRGRAKAETVRKKRENERMIKDRITVRQKGKGRARREERSKKENQQLQGIQAEVRRTRIVLKETIIEDSGMLREKGMATWTPDEQVSQRPTQYEGGVSKGAKFTIRSWLEGQGEPTRGTTGGKKWRAEDGMARGTVPLAISSPRRGGGREPP